MAAGPSPFPRVRLTNDFRAAVRASMLAGKQAWLLSTLAGFTQNQVFSRQLNAATLPSTPLTIERFGRVADAIGFPREGVFEAVPQ